ncbi:MAG TPA: VTT domain-containing protein [Trebonia sp.]|nr:VTT domain-containing protein [Trebonia sp.]
MSVGELISSYGYWALFALVAAESLGVPLPGETALIIAGTYAGTTHRLNPWLIFAVAAAAAIIGDNIGFWIGDKGGYRLARRYGARFRLDERKLKTARYLFDRHGIYVVFFGRFVSILRTYAAFLAGTSRMRWRKFLPANAAGGIVWAAIYTTASYLAGKTLQRASGTIDLVLAGAAIVAIIAVFLLVRRQAGRLADRAEAAYPGPLDGDDEPDRGGDSASSDSTVLSSHQDKLWRRDAMIHHVQLACPAGSEPALREFYGGVLGLAELQKPPVLAARGGCWFSGHGIELHLGVEQDFRPARKAHPGLLVEGLDGWASRLRDAGYPVLFDDDFPGLRRFYTQDPNGNRLEFLERVE